MKITSQWCDRCGTKWGTFIDKVTLKVHDRGDMSFDLCWDCSKELLDDLDRRKQSTDKLVKKAHPI